MMTASSGRVALIAGITGQDGAYLARFLLAKGYVVHGTSRDAAVARLDGLVALGICDKVELHSMPPGDSHSVAAVIERVAPDEIYNLAGQSSVLLSFTQPGETLASIALGTLNMLETLRRLGGRLRFYNAGSSECFGDTGTRAANEQTVFRPKSPYGVAKAAAISLVANYREWYWTLCLFRTPLQSRIAASAEPLRHPQDHPRGRQDRCRQPCAARSRQPIVPPRLGLGSRLCRSHVEDAAVRPAR